MSDQDLWCLDPVRTSPLGMAFQQYAQELQRFLHRRLGCPDTAADLMQETFLRVAQLPSSTQPDNPRAYLFRIASNLATDAMRRQQVRSAYELGDVETGEIASHAPSQETALEARQQCRLLREAVATLPTKCRMVFLLHKSEHLSYGEIAERLNISKSAVEKHMSKALAHCRDYMDRAGR